MLEKDGNHYCDRCGIKLKKDNNTCGYEICDKCNKELEKRVKEDKRISGKGQEGQIRY